MMKYSLFSLLLVVLSAAVAAAQKTDVPEDAVAEIIRRGDLVTQAGDGVRAGDDEQFAEAVRTPADDSNKWFISVLTSPGCRHCERLLHDWKTSEYLLAFANPDEPKQSWSHFNVYRSDDRTQKWRWKNIKIGGYPTIVIQPPRNRTFGDPGTVVMQLTGYDGDPKKLAAAMSRAIRHYIYKYSEARREGKTEAIGGFEQTVVADPQANNYDPPFTPAPPDQGGPSVSPFPVYQPVTIPPLPPQPAPQPNVLSLLFQALGGTLGSPALVSLLLMGLIGVQVWRALRKTKSQPLVLDDATFYQIRKFVLSVIATADKTKNGQSPIT